MKSKTVFAIVLMALGMCSCSSPLYRYGCYGMKNAYPEGDPRWKEPCPTGGLRRVNRFSGEVSSRDLISSMSGRPVADGYPMVPSGEWHVDSIVCKPGQHIDCMADADIEWRINWELSADQIRAKLAHDVKVANELTDIQNKAVLQTTVSLPLPCEAPLESEKAIVMTGSSGQSGITFPESQASWTTEGVLGRDTTEFVAQRVKIDGELEPASRHVRIEKEGDHCEAEIDGLPDDLIVKDRWHVKVNLLVRR